MNKQPNEPPVWHIASYPRSGNHLVRALLEYTAQQPTLGCPGASRDTPIHTRAANAETGLIKISDSAPIGVKSHFANQIKQNVAAHDTERFLLITRDPSEVISSQLCRVFGKKLFASERRIRRAVEDELNTYLSLLFAYRSHDKDLRCHARFEDLTGAENSLAAANALLATACPHCAPITAEQWDSIREVAKQSQISLALREAAMRDRIRDVVSARVTYAEVLNFLETGKWKVSTGSDPIPA